MTARFLALADVHLGASDRLADQVAVLDRIVNLAVGRRVDAVLFAGDATHHRSTLAEVAAFQAFVGTLNGLGIPFVGIAGNHDVSTSAVASTVRVAAEGFQHAQAFDQPASVAIAGVHIHCLPWCSTSAIAALDETGQIDAVARTSTEILMDVARGLRARSAGFPTLLLAHWSLAGSVTPTGAEVDTFREVVLPTRELSEMGWDLVVAGHIHSPGHLVDNVLYTGSAATCDFGEEHTEHGAWLVDVEDGGTTTEFVPIADRRFVTLTIDPDTAMFLPDVTDAIVRVRYTAAPEQERLVDHAAIREQILALGAHRVTTIEPTITGRESTRTAVTDDLSIDDAFVLWLDDQDDVDRDAVLAIHHEIREAVR